MSAISFPGTSPSSPSGRLGRAAGLALALLLVLAGQPARATNDPFTGLLAEPGGAGLGFVTRVEDSPYRGAGMRYDLVPVYLYKGRYVYLHAYRAGLRLSDGAGSELDVFLAHRFEGFPYDRIPPSLAGMKAREPEVDLGVGYQYSGPLGVLYSELLHDAAEVSDGTELRVGYRYEWKSGRWNVQPHFMLALRSARLNDYYYGVRPEEATALRPAYMPGSGLNEQLGVHVAYSLSRRWRLLAGITATRWARGVRKSPIVNDRLQLSSDVGLMYDFSPENAAWPERSHLILKLAFGKSTNCNLVAVMRLGCTSTRTTDQTRISAIEIGRPFIKRLNGWPLDIVGFLGLLHHNERGLQQDFWQINAYMKAYYYGFPWSQHVRTRLGFGAGVSYAQRLPYVEQRDQARRGRNSSRLLNYLDPTIDVSLGDLLGVSFLRDTYFGFGVSHRSGIFGTSQLLGNVNGGSNYIYSYVEWN